MKRPLSRNTTRNTTLQLRHRCKSRGVIWPLYCSLINWLWSWFLAIMAIKGETCLCYKKSKLYNVVSVIDHYFHLLASVLINSTTGDVLCRENVVLTSFVHLRSVQYPAGLELQACIANSPGSSYSPHFRKKSEGNSTKDDWPCLSKPNNNVSFEIIHFLLLSRFC